MSKKHLPALLTLLSILISTLLWEKITLPYDTQNQIFGEYSANLYNPNNDTFRFIIYIFLPLATFLISYLVLFKKDTYLISEVILNKNIASNERNLTNLNLLIFFIITILILEFFIINFEIFSKNIDHVHDGMLLTPSNNAFLLNKFWTSSYIERGLFAQFGPIFFWKLFEIKSIGLVHFNNLFFLFLNKIVLVFISAKIAKNLAFSEDIKKYTSLYYQYFLFR